MNALAQTKHRLRALRTCAVLLVGLCGRASDAVTVSTLAMVLEPAPATLSRSSYSGWRYEREAEAPDEVSVGTPGDRSAASGAKALLKFGCRDDASACTAQAGSVVYRNLELPEMEHLWIALRYSKYSQATTTIRVFLDGETVVRAEIMPEDQGGWNSFAWSDPADLGAVMAGPHTLRLETDGQPNGVADLDKLILLREPVVDPAHLALLTDEEFLDRVAHAGFEYFWRETDPATGIIKDRAGNHSQDGYTIGSTGATGFGLSALCIGASRRWVGEREARERALATLRFFRDRIASPHGFYYHFVDVRTGERSWSSELSSIDTALFIAGALTAGQCFAGTEVQEIASALYARVDWEWMRTNGGVMSDAFTIAMGWTPEREFLKERWDWYSELMILYLLGLGSPTHPIPAKSWEAWQRPTGEYAGHRCIEGGPLFMHQYTHAYVDFKGRKDRLGYDYFENSINCTLANRQFTIDHKDKFKTYGDHVWGLTASDTPTGGYDAYGAPPSGWSKHDGTINPSAAGGSIVFTPELSIAALRTMYDRYGHKLWGRYGFSSAFNVDRNWWSREVIGIDTGITLLMIENYRSGLVQRMFMSHPAIPKALELAGLALRSADSP